MCVGSTNIKTGLCLPHHDRGYFINRSSINNFHNKVGKQTKKKKKAIETGHRLRDVDGVVPEQKRDALLEVCWREECL